MSEWREKLFMVLSLLIGGILFLYLLNGWILLLSLFNEWIATEAAIESVGELWDDPQPMDPEAACGYHMISTISGALDIIYDSCQPHQEF